MAYASRHSFYLVGSLAAFTQALAEWWDIFSHPLFGGVDAWWNPAHLTLYTAVATTVLAVYMGLRVSKPYPPPLSVSPIRFVNVAGLKLAGFGCLIEIVAEVWNASAYLIFHKEPIIPAFILLTLGMLTVNLGIVIGLTIEYGMIRRNLIIVRDTVRWVTALCVLLSFSAIWLMASGALFDVGSVYRLFLLNWAVAVLMSLLGSLVLVCTKRVMPRFGSAVLVGVLFNAVSYLFLTVYVHVIPYVPWGLFALFIFDLVSVWFSRWVRFAQGLVLSSVVLGLLFWAVYFPFSRFVFPWSSSFQLPTVAVVVGSYVGGWLGNMVYTGLSSVVLGDVALD